ncbi:MAG: hypothetical protein FWC77_00475 [Defluviitaleaceae bacterium]|nr:hypothetical protein [Defluviitaleaceae bacterium]
MRHSPGFKIQKNSMQFKRMIILFCVLSLMAAVIAVVASDGDYGGYAGDAPGYYYFAPDTVHTAPIHIEIDLDGNINIYPHHERSVAIAGDYIHMQIPAKINLDYISVALPYGWTYETSHLDVSAGYSYYSYDDAEVPNQPQIHTAITINHTWNSSSGNYVGIAPLTVFNVPTTTTFTVHNLPANATPPQWSAAIGTTGNRVIYVQGNQVIPETFVIEAGRHVIITSSDTNLQFSYYDHVNTSGRQYTIAREQPGRHFIVRDGATLTLSHIILDGGVDDVPAEGVIINRGGVHVGGTPAAPRIGGARLVISRGASIRRNAWSVNVAFAGTYVGTNLAATTGVGAGVEAAGGMAAGYNNGGARVYMHFDGEVVENITTLNWGGGIHVRQGGHLTMHGGLVGENRTFRTADPTVSFNGSTAGVHVGAHESFTSTLTMHPNTTGNLAYNARISENTAYATRAGNVGIFRAGGAGVFVHQYCRFYMYGGYIEDNLLSGNRVPGSMGDFVLNGAGVLLLGRSAEGTSQANAARFYMYGGTIRNNVVSMAAAGVYGALGGGGVGLYGGVFTMNNGVIENNSAGEGGGVYLNTGGGGGTVIMNDGYIRNNRAYYGAGVGINPQHAMPTGVWGTTSFTMNGGYITGNRYSPTNGIPTRGGGVLVYGGVAHAVETHDRRLAGTFTMNGGTIEDNRAIRGGGVFLSGGLSNLGNTSYFGGNGAQLTLGNNTMIRDNTATYGGGIYSYGLADIGTHIGSSSSLTQLTGSIIMNNRAEYGAGVMVNNSTFLMQGGTIGSPNVVQPPQNIPFGNWARYGGGVFMTGENATFTQSGGLIAHNRADYGGGVYARGASQLTLTSTGLIRNNWQSRDIEPGPPPLNPDTHLAPLHILYGGGVLVRGTDTVFDMTGGTIGGEQINTQNFHSNRANRGGGVAVLDGAVFNLEAGAITGNIAGIITFYNPIVHGLMSHGGGVYVRGAGSEFNMTGGIIGGIPSNEVPATPPIPATPPHVSTGNTGTRGGGVAVHEGATFTMGGSAVIAGNCTWTGVTGGPAASAGIGGGVWVGANGEFILEAGHILRNRAVNGGGGIRTENGGVVHIKGGYIAGNRTTGAGTGGVSAFTGGIVVMDSGTIGGVNFNGNLIEGNRSASGGGVSVNASMVVNTGDGPITVPSTFIFNNGIIGGDRTISGGIMGNHATTVGGGVFVQAGAWFHMEDGQIIGNQAPNGGGVFATVLSALFTMDGGVIGGTNASAHHNIATAGAGGGVRVTNTGRFLMTNGHIINNRANIGGGVSIGGTLNAPPVTGLPPQPASADLDAYEVEVYYTTIEGQEERMLMHYYAMQMLSQLDDEDEHDYHDYYINIAPVYLEYGMHVPMSGLIIPSRPPVPTEQFRMTGANTIIESNRNTDGTSPVAEGGGVHVTGGATFRMLNGLIRDNHATEGGGVMVVNPNTVFSMYGGTIGYTYTTNPAYIVNPTIVSALANDATTGGGVLVGTGATFNMLIPATGTGGSITGNSASNGAGVALIGNIGINTAFNMHTGLISGNRASGGDSFSGSFGFINSGGGVLVVGSDATFTMHNGNIRNNYTPNWSGGGVNVTNDSAFIMHSGYIQNNRAGTSGGGGVAVRYGATFTMNNTSVIRNNASIIGGGVLAYNQAHFVMNNGTINSNTVHPSSPGVGGVIFGGGGVAVIANATAEMHDGTIRDHVVDMNNGNGDGGGVWVGLMPGNIFPGVHMSGLNSFTMTGGNIINNEARDGAGVFLEGGPASPEIGGFTHNHFIMTGGRISGNEARRTGGGVHVRDSGVFNMYSGTIGGERPGSLAYYEPNPYSNTAPQHGGGIALDTGAIMNLRGAGNKNIIGNVATLDGGGVWLAANSQFRMQATPQANNVFITYNEAGRMGGGIFTGHYEYNCPITVDAPFPGGATTVAYSNLTLIGVNFAGNTANQIWWPPSNRGHAALSNIGFASTSQYANVPAAVRHPLNNYDINYEVTMHRFDFFKTDTALYGTPPIINLLGGAQFRVFRNVNPELSPSLGTSTSYIVQLPLGLPLDPMWEEISLVNNIYTSPGSGTTPLGFYMDPRHTYQIVEVMTPGGFQIPFGQWRVSMTGAAINDVIVIGMHAPAAIRSTTLPSGAGHPIPARANLFYIGNMPDFELPLAGGSGTFAFVASGTILIMAAAFVVIFMKLRKNMVFGYAIGGPAGRRRKR